MDFTLLPINKEKWFNTGIIYDEWLIICNRYGHIYLYKILNFDVVEFKFVLKNVHDHLGITYIQNVNSINVNLYFQTCGRDGTIKTVKINKNENTLKIIHSQTVPIKWVIKLFNLNSLNDDQLLLTGFNDNHFLIWNDNYDVIKTILCGGGHRYFDIYLFKNGLYFTYVKNKRLYSHCISLNNYTINKMTESLISKFHIKSCNVLKMLDNTNVLISGGEDNKLLFFNKNYNNHSYEIHSHVSSIKDICYIQCIEDNKKTSSLSLSSPLSFLSYYLVFSCGGRAQICITKLLCNPLLDINSNLLNEEICNYMFKLNDNERKYHKKNNNKNDSSNSNTSIDYDPEMRFTSIDVFYDNENNNYNIYTGCSDGYIRKFVYDVNLSKISFHTELFYGKCILHVNLINDEYCKKYYLISSSTDGNICFWNIDNISKQNCHSNTVFYKVKHHNSSINSLDIIKYELLDENKSKNNPLIIYIASGGDDQNVTITLLKIYSSYNIEILRKFELNNLHTSQVNGIKFSYCKQFLYTVGIDQIVCKLNVLDNMKLIKKVRTCVADIKGLEIFRGNILTKTHSENWECIVYGWGRQFIFFQ